MKDNYILYWKNNDSKYIDPKCEWHKWFAWYPIECNGYTIWLEYIMRKRYYCEEYPWEYYYNYKFIKKEN